MEALRSIVREVVDDSLNEKAVSKAQQKFMGMVYAYKKGDMKDAPANVRKAAESMTDKEAKDFASTKHKGLPKKKQQETYSWQSLEENKMSTKTESIVKRLKEDTEYQKFFRSAMDKFGVKSPKELSDKKKKEFFNYVDKNYKAKGE